MPRHLSFLLKIKITNLDNWNSYATSLYLSLPLSHFLSFSLPLTHCLSLLPCFSLSFFLPHFLTVSLSLPLSFFLPPTSSLSLSLPPSFSLSFFLPPTSSLSLSLPLSHSDWWRGCVYLSLWPGEQGERERGRKREAEHGQTIEIVVYTTISMGQTLPEGEIKRERERERKCGDALSLPWTNFCAPRLGVRACSNCAACSKCAGMLKAFLIQPVSQHARLYYIYLWTNIQRSVL